MAGTVATFDFDLAELNCLIQSQGIGEDIPLQVEINGLQVRLTLKSINSPSLSQSGGTGKRLFYNKLSVSVEKTDEDLSNSAFIAGRAGAMLIDFHKAIFEVLNRLTYYFKYEKRHPNLTPVNVFSFLTQQSALFNPVWTTTDGVSISVPFQQAPLGSIPGLLLLREDLYGILPFKPDQTEELQRVLARSLPAPTLVSQLLSDAQSAALSGNYRRAILELAVFTETFVKSSFFKQERIGGAAFEYLEDKGRQTVSIPELLDGVASYSFGKSFKSASPRHHQCIDHLFRSRNKLAHRGEARFRDDSGAWLDPDEAMLREWWTAVIAMTEWLTERIQETQNGAQGRSQP